MTIESNLQPIQPRPTSRSARGPAVKVTWILERNAVRAYGLIGLILVWYLISLTQTALFLPSPFAVGKSLYNLTLHGNLLAATWQSFVIFALGFLFAAAIAVPFGFLTARSRIVGNFFDPIITIFWATPSVALLPVLVIWFGLKPHTQVIIVFLSTFFPVVLETQTGVSHVDRTLLRVADAFGANRRERLTLVLLPAALPYVITGLRIGVGRAVIGVIVAELYLSANGLGAAMTTAANYFKTADYFAYLVVFVLFSLIVTELVTVIERRFSRWRPE